MIEEELKNSPEQKSPVDQKTESLSAQNTPEPLKAEDVDFFLKKAEIFFPNLQKSYEQCVELLSPYIGGKNPFSAFLKNEKTLPYALEVARRILMRRFGGGEQNLFVYLREEIAKSLPYFDKQLHENSPNAQEGLNPGNPRRIKNNILYLVSEAAKSPSYDSK